jgi:hypothetical protein
VVYQPGELKVVAYKNGKKWATDVVKTTGPAAKLTLAADRDKIRADGQDLSFITVTVADKNGLLVPRSKNHIQFQIEGPGEIVATDNGDATSFESFQAPERNAFNGLALVIVRAKPGQPGTIKLTADGLNRRGQWRRCVTPIHPPASGRPIRRGTKGQPGWFGKECVYTLSILGFHGGQQVRQSECSPIGKIAGDRTDSPHFRGNPNLFRTPIGKSHRHCPTAKVSHIGFY